jgi:hypothetical protein
MVIRQTPPSHGCGAWNKVRNKRNMRQIRLKSRRFACGARNPGVSM